MKLNNLFKIGGRHLSNIFWEFFYLRFGINKTKPNTFYGIITDKCNSRCIYCHHWKIKNHNEISISEWKKTLLDIKKFVKNYSINFSGGEPFLKEDFLDLLSFLKKNKINFGVTTNGALLADKNLAEKIVALEPMNVNISCESKESKIHDYIRNWDGLHDKIVQAIKNLKESQKEKNIYIPIIMKATINLLNYEQLPDQIRWVKKLGLAGITLQPIGSWTEEARKKLFFEEKDKNNLEKIITEIIKLKKQGYPILNSEKELKEVINYFFPTKTKIKNKCRIGLRNLFIYPNGDLYLCTSMAPIGNVHDGNIKKIWYGQQTEKIRKQTIQCQELCLSACSANKTILDKIKIALKLIK